MLQDTAAEGVGTLEPPEPERQTEDRVPVDHTSDTSVLDKIKKHLKVWMTLRAYGTDRLGEVVEQCCALATRLAARIDAEPALERLAPVPLNIVCFRVRDLDDAANAALVADLHEDGSFAPSTTRIGGRLAIRAAIVNHRTRAEDVDGLVDAILAKRSVS